MNKEHHYTALITWTGNMGTGTSGYTKYERSHLIQSGDKAVIEASSDAPFRGDISKHNPEDLFLSSIASCHMLWYLHLCADNGVVVKSYIDKPHGIMQTFANGSGNFSGITLHPLVEVTEASMVETAIGLHHSAHQMCFLANSVNFEIFIEPTVRI
jgi:organic hydroperoxide reductase OsmC/OhrA